MSNKIATAGNNAAKVRSDCFVSLELKESGGQIVNMKSKVKALYGDSILDLCKNGLKFFEIENAELTIDDKGALPWVIMARIEATVKQLIDTDKEFLPEHIEENNGASDKAQFRFSRLYLPGNSPSMMLNAGIHKPNGLILDLEDSVAPAKKPEARLLVRNALRGLNMYGAERMVRINQGEMGIADLAFVVPHNVNLILVPKCESAEYIVKLDEEVSRIKKAHNITNPIWYMPIIESALGVEKAFEIATASDNVCSLAIGLEDFTADLGTHACRSQMIYQDVLGEKIQIGVISIPSMSYNSEKWWLSWAGIRSVGYESFATVYYWLILQFV